MGFSWGANKIASIDTDDEIEEYKLLTPNPEPRRIAIDDTEIWIVLECDKIGRIKI